MTKIIVGGYEVEDNGFEYLMSNGSDGNELQIVSLDSRLPSDPELNAVMEGKKNILSE
jgi:hypothetical protein